MWRQWTLWQAVYTTVVAALVGLSHAQHHILPNGGEIKAVLISATEGFENYDSEADVCHAYQILRKNGIPEENIIVIMTDDCAFNEMNPRKGVLINRPNGPDVYKNCKKDYTGKNNNEKVYFNVLLGNKDAVKGIGTERVLESGPNDTVFIYHSGHGNKGLVYYRHDSIIHASELLNNLTKMANSSRFKKMFFYLETCFSGSMFKLLPKNLSIFAMTSANPYESAWDCFCTNDTQAADFHCIGTEFDYRWMRDAETVDLRKETIFQQFERVRNETHQSHVHVYGDMRLGSTRTSEVLGFREQLVPFYDDICENNHNTLAVQHLISATKYPEERKRYEKKLQDLQQSHHRIVQFFSKLAEEVLTPDNRHLLTEILSNTHADITETNLACYEKAVTYLDDSCFKLSNDHYVGTQLHVLINLCNLVPEARLVEAMQTVYQEYPVHQVVL